MQKQRYALVKKEYRIPFILVTSLFFLWGFAHAILDVLNKHFQDVMVISRAHSAWVQVMFYLGYFVMAIPAGLFIVNGVYMVIRYRDPMLALLVSISLVATILIAKMIGCVLPLFAKKLHMDPAIMAAPLITTIVDVCSIMVYFQVATHLLGLI